MVPMAREPLKPHPHKPVNVNDVKRREHEESGFNTKLAVLLTRLVGTMPTAYLFALLALCGFPALSAWLGSAVAIYVIWFSQTFLQLTFLPILSVGQSTLNRHQELQADEEYAKTLKIYHDTELLIKHYNTLLEEIDYLKNTIALMYGEQIKHTDLLSKTPVPTRRKTKQQEVTHDE